MPEHSLKIIPDLLSKPLMATEVNAYRNQYIFIPYGITMKPDGTVKLSVHWKHWSARGGTWLDWVKTDITFNKYSYEVLNADFSRTGAVFHPE